MKWSCDNNLTWFHILTTRKLCDHGSVLQDLFFPIPYSFSQIHKGEGGVVTALAPFTVDDIKIESAQVKTINKSSYPVSVKKNLAKRNQYFRVISINYRNIFCIICCLSILNFKIKRPISGKGELGQPKDTELVGGETL